MTRFTLRLDGGWESEFLRSEAARDLVEFHTADVAALVIKEAPRASATKDNWNRIKANVEAALADAPGGWYGNVVLEDDDRVRHALLQEFGYRDPAGHRHPGRLYLKRALERARIE
jgi:hypothetical protein